MTTEYTKNNSRFPSPAELNRRLEAADLRKHPLRARIAAKVLSILRKPEDKTKPTDTRAP